MPFFLPDPITITKCNVLIKKKSGIIAFIHIQVDTIQHHNVLEMAMITQLMFKVKISTSFGKAKILNITEFSIF